MPEIKNEPSSSNSSESDETPTSLSEIQGKLKNLNESLARSNFDKNYDTLKAANSNLRIFVV